jgi:hypothetical protein
MDVLKEGEGIRLAGVHLSRDFGSSSILIVDFVRGIFNPKEGTI